MNDMKRRYEYLTEHTVSTYKYEEEQRARRTLKRLAHAIDMYLTHMLETLQNIMTNDVLSTSTSTSVYRTEIEIITAKEIIENTLKKLNGD